MNSKTNLFTPLTSLRVKQNKRKESDFEYSLGQWLAVWSLCGVIIGLLVQKQCLSLTCTPASCHAGGLLLPHLPASLLFLPSSLGRALDDLGSPVAIVGEPGSFWWVLWTVPFPPFLSSLTSFPGSGSQGDSLSPFTSLRCAAVLAFWSSSLNSEADYLDFVVLTGVYRWRIHL